MKPWVVAFMLYRRVAIIICISLALPAYAGAWLQPEGKGLAIANATYYATNQYFDVNGQRQSQPRFSKYEFQPYAEYGLRHNLTIGGSAYIQHVAQSGATNNGIADPEFFARTRLWYNDKQVISIQPLVKFRSYFAKKSPPRGGSQSMDGEVSLLYGRNFPVISARDYVDMRVGYRLRSQGLGDQLRTDAALGLNVTDRIQIIPAIRTVAALNSKDAAIYSENGEQDYSVVKAEITGIYNLNNQQWLQASVFKHVAGIQTGDGDGISIGYAQRF